MDKRGSLLWSSPTASYPIWTREVDRATAIRCERRRMALVQVNENGLGLRVYVKRETCISWWRGQSGDEWDRVCHLYFFSLSLSFCLPPFYVAIPCEGRCLLMPHKCQKWKQSVNLRSLKEEASCRRTEVWNVAPGLWRIVYRWLFFLGD